MLRCPINLSIEQKNLLVFVNPITSMKKRSGSQSAFFNPRVLIGFASLAGVFLVLLGFGVFTNVFAEIKSQRISPAPMGCATCSVFDAQAVRSSGTQPITKTSIVIPEQPSPQPPINCTWAAGPVLPTNIMDNAVAAL